MYDKICRKLQERNGHENYRLQLSIKVRGLMMWHVHILECKKSMLEAHLD